MAGKPHIKRAGGLWQCGDGTYLVFGYSPCDAYKTLMAIRCAR